MRYLELEDLVVNAFIYYNTKTGKHVLSMKKILEYGKRVVKDINKGTNNYTCLKISDLRTAVFFNGNEEFQYYDIDKLVIMKQNVKVERLIRKYVTHYPEEVIEAFQNEENCRVLDD